MKKFRTPILALVIFAIALGAFFYAGNDTGNQNDLEPELLNGLLIEPISFKGDDYLVPPTDIYEGPVTVEESPAVDTPKHISIASADAVLADQIPGIKIANNTETRFYAFQIMNWHQVVNDTFNDQPILVTHCPLCKGSAVYNRVVDGQTLTFEISGKNYQNNTILRDRETGSLWLQGRGIAISGELMGTQLDLVNYETVSWSNYKREYPTGTALSTNTGFTYNYAAHPYGNYDVADLLYFPVDYQEGTIVAKWDVTGVAIGDEQVAFAHEVMRGTGVKARTVSDQRIIAFFDEAEQVIRVFEIPADFDRTFTYSFDDYTITDDQGVEWSPEGSTLNTDSDASITLTEVPTRTMFWFCWSMLYPETKLAHVEESAEEVTTPNETEQTTLKIDLTE